MILITGASGQLGDSLQRLARARNLAHLAVSRPAFDFEHPETIQSTFTAAAPTIVINAAAYTAVDAAETNEPAAIAGNHTGPATLAALCAGASIPFIHVSTDYVFDGELGRPYTETDAVHPLGAYAVSKLAGELYAQAYLSRPLVVRTSGVFGPGGMRTARGNFPELMLRLAREGKPIRVVEDHVASPTYAPLLASRSIEILERNLDGVFHCGGWEAVSWFDYARLIFQQAGIEADLKPTNEREYRTEARRPKFSALDNARMRECSITAMPPLAEAVAAYLAARQAEPQAS